MSIIALGYLGVRSDKLDDWFGFATRRLGMHACDQGGNSLSFRMDDWRQRFVVTNEPGSDLAFMGWQVDHASDLERYATRLDAADTPVFQASRALCDQRFVDHMIYFDDPDGNRIELFHAPETTTDPFISGRPIEGFKTGAYGMGHAVLHVKDAHALMPFYRDILEFSLSDYALSPIPLFFFHVNGRHHSFAMIGTGRTGFHHFMIEYANLDDVGQGYDLAQLEDNAIAYTLGRHTNDYMTSFYAHTPSDFFVENGWGGRVIDPATWEPHETSVGPSFWGHERLHLPEAPRSELREMRLAAARNGLRAPAIADCPWLYDHLKGTLRD